MLMSCEKSVTKRKPFFNPPPLPWDLIFYSSDIIKEISSQERDGVYLTPQNDHGGR